MLLLQTCFFFTAQMCAYLRSWRMRYAHTNAAFEEKKRTEVPLTVYFPYKNSAPINMHYATGGETRTHKKKKNENRKREVRFKFTRKWRTHHVAEETKHSALSVFEVATMEVKVKPRFAELLARQFNSLPCFKSYVPIGNWLPFFWTPH